MANDSDSDGSTTIDWAALPSGFRERFLILLLTGVLFTAYLASTVWVDAAQHWRDPGRPVIFTGDVTSLQFVFIGVLVFVATTLVVYLLHPVIARRVFGKGHPLEPGTALGRLASDLALQMKLSRVAFSVTSDLRDQTAIAFGFPGRRQVSFGGGMRLVVSKAPTLARTVIAHEFGHLRHSDVDLGLLTRGVAWATACLAGVTLVIQVVGLTSFLSAPQNAKAVANLWTNFWHGRIPIMQALEFAHQWELLYGAPFVFVLGNPTFFFLVLYLEYAAALRSREHYADLFARSVVGADTLNTLFSVRRRNSTVIPNIFRTHPTIVDRYRVVTRPDLVLRPTILQALASGYLAGLFIVYATTYMTDIRPDPTGTHWGTSGLPQCCDTNWLVNALVVGLTSLLVFVLVGSLNLRLAAFARVAIKARTWLFVATVLLALPFSTGVVLGEFLNPLTLWRLWSDWPSFGGATGFLIANPKAVLCLIVAIGFVNQLVYTGASMADLASFRWRVRRFIALPLWVLFVHILSVAIIALAPAIKGPGLNWLEIAIQDYQQREAKPDEMFRDAQEKVFRGDRVSPDSAVELYTSARKTFELIQARYPDSKSAAAIHGANGNPITLTMVEDRLRNAECTTRPALACLMQLAHGEAFGELTMGLMAANPQIGLAAIGSVMIADQAPGTAESAHTTAQEIVTRLAPIPARSAVFMSSPAYLMQLANALAMAGRKDEGIEIYQRITGGMLPSNAMLLTRVLAGTKADLASLQQDIEGLPAVPQFVFLVDLARRALALGAATEATTLIDKALSIAPAGPQALYLIDVVLGRDDASAIWQRLSAGLDLHSLQAPWLLVAVRHQAFFGDAAAALDFARGIADGRVRARAFYEIAVAQAQTGKPNVKETLAQGDASAGQALWTDAALALIAIEAHAWAGDATTAMVLTRKTQSQGYHALAFARIACALSGLRHPLLFFANRPPL
ncbi:M48 family metalloprotease [Bradyrhizobium sp.]|uniref:M48 family metalloprotease n=1 Tax=Bradyrhizobium sp. TaxID=376 RepID=UPI003918C91E